MSLVLGAGDEPEGQSVAALQRAAGSIPPGLNVPKSLGPRPSTFIEPLAQHGFVGHSPAKRSIGRLPLVTGALITNIREISVAVADRLR